MRRIDKRLNIQKANLLTEQRYLNAKIGINENVELQRGEPIVWIAGPENINGEVITPSSKGTYIGREISGEEVVEFGGKRFLTSRGKFECVKNLGQNQSLNQASSLINHVKNQGGLQ